MTRNRVQGFSLIELMIAVVIIGVLAAIAIPQYSQYKIKTRRSTAESALESFANAMERHYTLTNSYLGAANGGANSGAPDATIYPTQVPPSGNAYYTLSIVNDVTASFYRLRATPIVGGPQDGDGYLELQSTGARGWDKNNDGDTADAGESSWN